jgi:hypothetical protein
MSAEADERALARWEGEGGRVLTTPPERAETAIHSEVEMELKEQVIIVTGGASGIGIKPARALARMG